MKNNLVILIFALIFCFLSNTVVADQFFGGLLLNPVSGQPNFEADGILNGGIGYETERFGLTNWRFSYTMTNFRLNDDSSVKIKSNILAAETLFVAKIRSGLSLIGAIGPALFQTAVESGDSFTSIDIGLSATGSLRFALSNSLFLSAAFHYKNCAVSGSGSDQVVDGGYQGLMLEVGTFF